MKKPVVTPYCEYRSNPIGLDSKEPEFSWIVETPEKNAYQEAYRILVADSEEGLWQEKGIVWDSGTVRSGNTVNVPYKGAALRTAGRYYYRIEVKTNYGERFISEPSYFVMGLMEEPWDAPWIGGSLMEEHTFYFRKGMRIEKALKQATAFIVSPNYYVFTVNGRRCTDSVLNNAWTDCEKTALYFTYPVTEWLSTGENVLGIEVGNGWNAERLGEVDYGIGEHLFSMKVLLEYEDGTREWTGTNLKDWYFSVDGPMLFNSIYHGEIYDARKELDGWDSPGYDMEGSGKIWREAVQFEPPRGKIRAQTLEPIRIVEQIRPVEIHEVGDGSYTLDMGQNFAGWGRLTIEGEAGDEIHMKFAEIINPDFSVNQANLRIARATDTYILKGQGIETYEPRFTYHGFRYIQVFGLKEKPKKDTVIGCVVHSDVKRIGEFVSSSRLLNQLYRNIQWTERSNLHGLPTDCPQRDERLGWTNDMTVRNEGALYNFRLPRLYDKWMGDIRDTQGEMTGAISDTAPFVRFGSRPADPVGAALLLVPWNVYCHYGNKKILEENYEAMKSWVTYLIRNSNHYIVKHSTMGDWAAPIGDNDTQSIGAGAVSMVTPTILVATGFLYYDCCILKKIAEVLGFSEDAAFYEAEAKNVQEAFEKKFYNEKKHCYAANSQAANTIPLYFGMVEDENKEEILENIVRDIVEKHKTHLSTGNLCSRYIIEVLLLNGKEDLAYELLTQTTYPSWGYMIENGATTLWERWEKVTEEGPLIWMASHNHPMYGSVGVCFHKYLAGIQADEAAPGFENILIRPVIPEKMEEVKASLKTMRGFVQAGWKKRGKELIVEIVIPFNTTAQIQIPCKAVVEANELSSTRSVKVNGNEVELADGQFITKVGSGTWKFIISG